jgi:aerobic carbon-monoxide dehydrogenase medium subunit
LALHGRKGQTRPDQFADGLQGRRQIYYPSICDGQAGGTTLTSLALHTPQTLAEAAELLARYGGDARPIAGGTALVLLLRQGLIAPTALIRMDRIAGLDSITVQDGAVHLGPMVRLRQIAESDVVQQHCPVLAQTCGLVGNIRVRNAATVGGNVCEADYASDPPGVLVALDARVRTVSQHGEREIPVADFIIDFLETSLAPDELVAEVVIPALPSETQAVHYKYLTRSSEDRPCVGTTAVLRVDSTGAIAEARVAVGAVAGRPLRIPELEKQAVGQPPTASVFGELADAYAAAADPIADVRGSAQYRKRMIAVFVRRALQAAAEGRQGAWKC